MRKFNLNFIAKKASGRIVEAKTVSRAFLSQWQLRFNPRSAWHSGATSLPQTQMPCVVLSDGYATSYSCGVSDRTAQESTDVTRVVTGYSGQRRS
jgi:hypothetical protein